MKIILLLFAFIAIINATHLVVVLKDVNSKQHLLDFVNAQPHKLEVDSILPDVLPHDAPMHIAKELQKYVNIFSDDKTEAIYISLQEQLLKLPFVKGAFIQGTPELPVLSPEELEQTSSPVQTPLFQDR